MKITMAHGSGGYETAQLINDVFMRHFSNPHNAPMEDAAIIPAGDKLAFTTDSYVVDPLFFPGGDIGHLAVCGTVNDLVTTGATPLYLSAGFILHEGLPLADLDAVCQSMAASAKQANVSIVTGDTKVVEGSAGMFINTSGIGVVSDTIFSFSKATTDDVLIVTGNLGNHYASILSSRMKIENTIRSDVAPLTHIVTSLRENNIQVHGMRDITRGGLGTILGEITAAIGLATTIHEDKLPLDAAVVAFAKILGMDPLYMGNEGNAVLAVPVAQADQALAAIQKTSQGKNAAVIGQLEAGTQPLLITKFGSKRAIQPLRGQIVPRIC